jgi:YD repeat-containing protein
VTDPSGGRTEATYDDLDRQITATVDERTPTLAYLTTATTYDDSSNATSTTLPSGARYASSYDGAHQLVTATSPSGVVTKYGYDGLGRQLSVTDGLGRASKAQYDSAGRMTSQADYNPAGAQLRLQAYTYDLAGQLTVATPASGRPTSYSYDAAGQLTRQSEPIDATNSITTSFGYDAAGHRTRYTDGRNNATFYTYNTMGGHESVVEPATTAHPAAADRTWTSSYDANRQATTVVAPGAVRLQREYDANGQVTTETGTVPGTGGGADSVTTRRFGYDILGRPSSAGASTSTGTGTNSYRYNDRGLLVDAHGPSGESSYGYMPPL